MPRRKLPEGIRRRPRSLSLPTGLVARIDAIKKRTLYPRTQIIEAYLTRAMDTWKLEEVLGWKSDSK